MLDLVFIFYVCCRPLLCSDLKLDGKLIKAMSEPRHFLLREARGDKAIKFSTRRRHVGSLSSTTDTTYSPLISSTLLYDTTDSVGFERGCENEDRSHEMDATVERRRLDSMKTWNGLAI